MIIWSIVGALPLGAFRFGNSGRNVLDGPGLVEMNLSLMKRFRLRERGSLQFRCEAFNIMNHPNFAQPQNAVNASNGATITRADPPRMIQVALRATW